MMKGRQPGMAFIFITILIDVIGLGIIIPVLPDLIASLTHSTITEAATWGGWLIGVYAFMRSFYARSNIHFISTRAYPSNLEKSIT